MNWRGKPFNTSTTHLLRCSAHNRGRNYAKKRQEAVDLPTRSSERQFRLAARDQ